MQIITKSEVVIHDPIVCAGCGICEIMCSFYHENVLGSALASARVGKHRQITVGIARFYSKQKLDVNKLALLCR